MTSDTFYSSSSHYIASRGQLYLHEIDYGRDRSPFHERATESSSAFSGQKGVEKENPVFAFLPLPLSSIHQTSMTFHFSLVKRTIV